MTATTFDVRAFNRHSGDVATALLSAIDLRDLEKREEELAEREADVTRREKAIDRLERMHQLHGGSVPVSVASLAADPQDEVVATATTAAPAPTAQATRRQSFHDAFRLRELEWWTKVLGVSPSLS